MKKEEYEEKIVALKAQIRAIQKGVNVFVKASMITKLENGTPK